LYLYSGNAKNKKFFPPLKSTNQKKKSTKIVRQKFAAYMRDHPYIRDPVMRAVTIGGLKEKDKDEGPFLFHFYASLNDVEEWEEYKIFSRKPKTEEEKSQIRERYSILMSPLLNIRDTNSSAPPCDPNPETTQEARDLLWADGLLN
jgi:hypothetical protein